MVDVSISCDIDKLRDGATVIGMLGASSDVIKRSLVSSSVISMLSRFGPSAETSTIDGVLCMTSTESSAEPCSVDCELLSS